MKYRATFKATRYFVGMFVAISGFIFLGAILLSDLTLFLLALGILGFFILVRLRLRIQTNDSGLVYTGLLTRWEAEWQEIVSLRKMKDYGYPIDRMYSQLTYEFRKIDGSRKRISFLFFSGECLAEIKKRISQQN